MLGWGINGPDLAWLLSEQWWMSCDWFSLTCSYNLQHRWHACCRCSSACGYTGQEPCPGSIKCTITSCDKWRERCTRRGKCAFGLLYVRHVAWNRKASSNIYFSCLGSKMKYKKMPDRNMNVCRANTKSALRTFYLLYNKLAEPSGTPLIWAVCLKGDWWFSCHHIWGSDGVTVVFTEEEEGNLLTLTL